MKLTEKSNTVEMLEVTAQITLKKKSLAFTMVNTYLHRFQSAICWEKKFSFVAVAV